jgi:hypothetical protein
MRQPRSFRLLAFVLLLMLGLGTLPISPAAAAKCATIGPGANLNGCDLSGLDLSRVNLSGANLRGANLEGTNLDGANLSEANLNNARVTEGALDNADTSGANLRGITWVPAPVGRTVTLSFVAGGFEGGCVARVDVTGFTPGTHELLLEFVDMGGYRASITVGVDGTGKYDSWDQSRAAWSKGPTVIAMVNGISSAPTVVAC